jgi:hypothetical protein
MVRCELAVIQRIALWAGIVICADGNIGVIGGRHVIAGTTILINVLFQKCQNSTLQLRRVGGPTRTSNLFLRTRVLLKPC